MTKQDLQQLKRGDTIRVLCRYGTNAGRMVRAEFIELKYPIYDKKKMYYHFMNIDWGVGSIFTCTEEDLLSATYVK